MLLMIVQHPQRGWQSRTRVLCAPRSGRRSLTATAAEGTRSSAPSLLVAAARREGRPFIMRGRRKDASAERQEQRPGREDGRTKMGACWLAGSQVISVWLGCLFQLGRCCLRRCCLRRCLLRALGFLLRRELLPDLGGDGIGVHFVDRR